jgi:hypothetical protein
MLTFKQSHGECITWAANMHFASLHYSSRTQTFLVLDPCNNLRHRNKNCNNFSVIKCTSKGKMSMSDWPEIEIKLNFITTPEKNTIISSKVSYTIGVLNIVTNFRCQSQITWSQLLQYQISFICTPLAYKTMHTTIPYSHLPTSRNISTCRVIIGSRWRPKGLWLLTPSVRNRKHL